MGEDVFLRTAETVSSYRPEQNMKFDQYFMKPKSMALQAANYFTYLQGKNVLFLGDGDGAAAHYELLAEEGVLEPMNEAYLLDFDERIINYHNKVISDHCRNSVLKTRLYNVLDPAPKELRGKFDVFYINPPYGSYNKGLSTIVWVHRCISLCKKRCGGLLIIPNDERFPWSLTAYQNIVDFLKSKGFRIVEEQFDIHTYDEAVIRSSTLVVESVNAAESEYADTVMPEEMIENLYGKHIEIPPSIKDNGSQFGEER